MTVSCAATSVSGEDRQGGDEEHGNVAGAQARDRYRRRVILVSRWRLYIYIYIYMYIYTYITLELAVAVLWSLDLDSASPRSPPDLPLLDDSQMLLIGIVEPGLGRRLLGRVDRRTAQRRRMITGKPCTRRSSAIFSHGPFDQPSDTPTPASLAGM